MSPKYHALRARRPMRLLQQQPGRARNAMQRRLLLEPLEQRAMLATLTWTGASGAQWSNPANWAGSVAPQTGDNLIFPAGAASFVSQNDLPDGIALNTIQFTGSGYSITAAPGAHSIQLAGGVTANHDSGANTLALDITLQNAQTILTANPAATLNVTGAIRTGNLLGATHFLGTSALYFDGAGTTFVSATIDGRGSITKFGGGTVVLAGANTYEGITDVRQGVLRAQHSSALGSAVTGDTQIQAGAALHVAGGITLAEDFAVREGGVGFGDGTDGSTLGALRSVGGSNVITGNIDLAGGNNLIGVDAGSTLIVTGVIASPLGGTNRLIKAGDGVLQLAGAQDNVYRGETRVLKGVLELNKTAGRNAIGGDLVIGDNIGGDNGATVRLLASNQIPQLNFYETALNTTTIFSSGVLNFNNHSDAIGALVLTNGTTYSADVATGSGTLTLGGTLTVNGFQGSSVVSPAATISGRLDLGDLFSGGAAGTGDAGRRIFNINDTQLPNVSTDLIISADIIGAAEVSLHKQGGGTLQLAGNNTALASPFIMNGGIIEVGSNTAFGTGLLSLQNGGNVLRAVGASRTISNTLSLDGDVSFLGDDAVAGAENVTFTGGVTLTASRTLFTMDPTQNVTFAGVIGEGIFGSVNLAKSGRGTLTLAGANTLSGTVTVNADGGTMVLAGQGSLQNVNGLQINIGGTFVLDNTGTVVSDRINDARAIGLQGRLLFRGNAAANVTEFVGNIDPNQNTASVIEVENVSAGAFSSVLVANAMTVGGDRPTRFIGTGLPLTESGPNRFETTLNPGGLDDSILPQALVVSPTGRLDLATFGAGPNGFAIIPLPDSAYVTDISQASVTSNVRLTSSAVLTSNKSVNSILFEDGVTLSGADAVLTVNSGRLLFRGDGALNVGTANVGSGLIYVDAGSTVEINSNIYAGTIQKNGPGTLILTGDNHHTGNTLVNEGTLNVRNALALGAASAGTFVRANAVLELEETTFGPLNFGLEPLQIDGTGGMTNSGAIRVLSNVTWAGNVSLGGGAVNLLDPLGGFPLVNPSVPFVHVAPNTTYTITGDFGGSAELAKIGGGTLELAGVISRGTDRNNRILEGTLFLNNEAGIQASRGRYFVGSDVAGAPPAVLRLGTSDEIIDDRRVEVFASGTFDLNGNNEVIAEGNLILHVAPSGAGDVTIGAGGTLTINAGIQVHTMGTGNPVGSTITGGTLALQIFGTIAGFGSRTFHVNDGALGADLTVTSTIVDGTGLQSVGITKDGFGTLVLGGTTANTFTGDTVVNEGTLVLDKGTGGAGGVNAIGGRLFIGDNNPQSGFSSSDIVRLNQPEQIPDYTAQVEIRTTGRFDLAGNDETIGVVDAQNALIMQASSTVDLGGGKLAVIGNVSTNSANGANLWTPIVAPQIVNGTLDLGNINPTFFLSNERTELPFELEISANIIGSAGFVLANNSTLLLSGDNSGLTGDVVRTDGNFAIASDTALGSGRFLTNGGHLTTYGGPRNITSNSEIVFTGTIAFLAGNNTAGSGTIGGGGNDLKISSPVTLAANFTPVVATAGQVEFAGGVGESYTGSFVRKQGYGTMILSSPTTFSGNLEIGQDSGASPGFNRNNGGHVILRDGGTLLNSSVLIGAGGVFEVDNSGLALANRMADGTIVDLAGGILALTGKSGSAVSEIFGQLRLRDNSASSEVHLLLPSAAGTSATWRFASLALQTANVGASVKFVGRGTAISETGANRIGFIASPSMVNGIIPYAVLEGASGLDFATIVNPTPTSAPADNFLTALTSGPNFATTLAGATATTNVKLAANESVGGAITANALLLPVGGRAVSGAGSLVLGSGLLASSGNGNAVSVASLTLGGAEGMVYVDRGSLDLSSSISGTGATSTLANGGNGLLILSGANFYTGTMRVTGGTVRATNDLAFGTTAGGVNLTYGGTLELSNVNIPAELLNLAGLGETNLAAVGLRNIAGNSVWQGDINLRQNRTAIDVLGGTSLTIGTASTSGNVTGSALNKFGLGTLQFAGLANNTFNTTSIIWQGTLELNKSAGSNAIALNDNNEFFVGNFYGGDDSAVVRLLTSDQIGDGPYRMRVMPSGVLDLNGFSDTIVGRTTGSHDVLALDIGSIGSGDVRLNGGVLRISNTTTDNGRIQVRVLAGGSPQPATITGGTLELFGTTGGITRRILVDDSAAVEDLIITSTIADGGAVGTITKNNNGRLVLAPTAVGGNTFTAATIIEGGEVVVRHANALGAATGGTTVNSGLTLIIDGVGSAEPLTINGTGFAGQGVVRSVAGTNVWSGGVTLAGAVLLGVNVGELDIAGAIAGGTNGVTKFSPGTLTYSGASPNTYTGATLVSEGTLRLNKNAGINAIAGILTVGNDNGPQDADVVILAQANQIADGVQVQVSPSGRLDLNGNNETLGNAAQTGLNLFTGPTTAARIVTGAGTLTLASGLGVQMQAAGNLGTQITSSPGATIAGNLALGGNTIFNVVDSGLNIRELVIDAIMAGTAGLQRSGTGILVINGSNAGLSGNVTLNAGGGLVIGNNGLGTGTVNVAGNTSLFATNYNAASLVTQTISNNITLNETLNLRGDDNLTLSGAITNNASNRTINANMQQAAVTTLAGTINLSNDGTSRVLTINNNTFGGGVDNTVVGGTINITGQVVNGGSSTASGWTKGGVGLVVLSNSTNNYGGLTTVAGGVLLVTADALGVNGNITTNHTQVNGGTTLAVAAGVTLSEWIRADNNGFGNFGNIRLMDVLPGVTETATIAGNVNFNNTTFVGVDGGGANPDRLLFTGHLNSGGGQMNKVGFGEMEVAGASDNGVTFTGGPSPWDDGIQVRQGTLLINKTGALRAISGGTITVGDGGGGDNVDRLILIGSGTDQLGGNLNVDVGPSGLFLLGGATASEAIGQLNLQRLGSLAGDADTGAGTLIMNNNIIARNIGLTTGATPAGTVSGNVNLNGGRNFSAQDSFVIDPAADLIIHAQLSNGSFTANEFGTTMVTNAANTNNGASVNGQALDFNQSYNFGLAFPTGGTLIPTTAGALGTGNVTINAGGLLLLDNVTYGNQNFIADGATLTVAGGRLELIGSNTGSTEVIGNLTLNAGNNFATRAEVVINSSAGGITELLAGALTRNGQSLTNFIGVGANLGDTTNSRIQITAGTSPFTNNTLFTAGTVQGPAGFDLVTDADGNAAAAPYYFGRVTTYANDINAGGNAIVRLDGSEPAANRDLLANNTIAGLILENGVTISGNATLTMQTGGQGLIVSRGGSNVISATRLDFGGREPLFLIDTGASLDVASNLTGTNTLRKEGGGNLILSGDNEQGAGLQYTGQIQINAGTVTARHSDAFGTTAGDVNMHDRSALVLDGNLTFGNEVLRIRGTGLNNDYTGALRIINGNTTWGTGGTAVNYDTNPVFIDVAGGNQLILNAVIGGGGNPSFKIGAGELVYQGNDNSNTGAITVNAGTLTLDKAGTNRAIRSTLTIDDLGNFDAFGGSVVRYAATAGSNQIDDGVSVVVNHQGALELGAASDTINALTINGGTVTTTSGTLTENGVLNISGGSFSGNLVLNNALTYNDGLVTSGPATLSGSLNLGGATRTFTVNDGRFANDLTINSLISNGGISKTGGSTSGGTLLLTNANSTYAGGTTLLDGMLAIGASSTGLPVTAGPLGTGVITITPNDDNRFVTLLSQGATRTLGNAINLNPANVNRRLVLGGFYSTPGQDLVLSGPLTLQNNSQILTEWPTTATISGSIGESGGARTLQKSGLGMLMLSGNNSYTGATTLSAGIVQAQSLTAFGTTAGGVTVASGAELQLATDIGDEALSISGNGWQNRTGSPATFTGALRSLSGTRTWGTGATPITVSATSFVGVDAGTMILNGTVAGTVTLNKVGSGTLQFAGTASNTFTGTLGILEGVVELNKTGGLATQGPIQVGDNVGGNNVDVLSSLRSDQILDTTNVTVNSSGVWTLNGNNEGFGPYGAATTAITLIAGESFSGDINLGGGTLTLTGNAGTAGNTANVIVSPRPGISSAVAPQIFGAGTLTIVNGATAGSTFTVNESPAEVDLVISAEIAGATGSLIKQGAGRLVLSGDNTYGGVTTVAAGVLRIEHADALGDTGADTNTVIANGASLELNLPGTNTIDNETINSLNGTGIINEATVALFNNLDRGQRAIGTGALRNLTGNTTWTSNIVLQQDNVDSIDVAAGSLTLTGVIAHTGGGNAHLLKTGPGVLELGGVSANTYNGNTYIADGTLRLNKQGSVQAIPLGEVVIGDNMGADNADLLQYATGTGTDQIGDRVIRIGSTGRLDLNGNSDTINNGIVLTVGPTASSDVVTGSGTLTSNNQFTVVNRADITAASPAATFSGTYDLNGATRNIDVREGNADVEFDIQGVIQVTGNFGITKIGQGRLRLSNANTYTGATTVNVGVLEVGNNDALGTISTGTTVANNAALEFRSTSPLTIPEPITASGDGWNNSGDGVIAGNSTASVTLTAPITLPSTSYLGSSTIGSRVPGSTLTLGTTTSFLGNLVLSGAGDIAVPNSLVSQTIAGPYFSNITGRMFNGVTHNITTTAGIEVVANTGTPTVTQALFGPLNFPQNADAAFNAFFGLTFPDQIQGAFVGEVTILTAGTYYFAASNNDDTGVVWVDSDQSGAFDVGAELLQSSGCCNSTSVGSVFLNPGTYRFAYAFTDTGGGSGVTGRFQPATFGIPTLSTSMPIVSSVAQGNVIKRGDGTATFTGAHSYNETIVEGGGLLANNVTSSLGGGLTTTNTTGTLGGFGTVLEAVVVDASGTINPGDATTVGTLTIDDNVTFNSGSTLHIDFASAVSYDVLVVNGNVSLSDANLVAIGSSFAANLNDEFLILQTTGAGVVSGRFAGLLNSGDEVVSLGSAVPAFLKPVIDYAGGDGDDIVIRLVERNIPPVLTVASPTVAAVEPTANQNGTFSDGDATDVVTITASVGTVTYIPGATGTWTWSLSGLDGTSVPAGPFPVTITIDDNKGRTNSVSNISFTYTVANASPIAVSDAITTSEDSSGSVDVLLNDTDPAGPLADPLTVVAFTQGAAGTTVTRVGSTFTYNPGNAFQYLGVGQTAIETFTYTIDDGDGGTAVGTVTVTINGANDAPQLSPPLFSSVGGLVGQPVVNSGNYFDDFGDNVTFQAFIGGIETGTITKTGTNSGTWTWNYIPQNKFTGTVTVVATDANGLTASVSFGIEVANQAVINGQLFVAGTDNADRIIVQTGTSGGVTIRMNNVILPRKTGFSSVVVFGNDGNDTITVSGALPVPVELHGGEGDDYLSGGGAGDTLDGGPGRDRLFGNNGHDTLLGGDGNDSLNGGNGNDYIGGDEEIDILGGTELEDGSFSAPGDIIPSALPGNDSLSGHNGNDLIFGGAGNDFISGGAGNDILRGGAGSDRMQGGSGNDLLTGDIGSDLLQGNAGRDVLIGGMGLDIHYGGSSADLIFGGTFEEGSLDLAQLILDWSSSATAEDARLALEAVAEDDNGTSDSLNGEGDGDWFLTFLRDFFQVSSERRDPNKIFPLA